MCLHWYSSRPWLLFASWVRLIESVLKSYCNQTLAIKCFWLTKLLLTDFTRHQVTLHLCLSNPLAFSSLLVGSGQWAWSVPCSVGSDYSVDCSVSTCYCLFSGDMFRRAIFSSTLPDRDSSAQLSLLEYQCLLVVSIYFSPAPLWPLFWKISSVPWRIFLKNKVDLSQCAMLDAERPTANATLGNDESVWS